MVDIGKAHVREKYMKEKSSTQKHVVDKTPSVNKVSLSQQAQ